MRRRVLSLTAATVAMCTSLACGTTLQETGHGNGNLSVGGEQGLGGPGGTATGPGGGLGAGTTGAGAGGSGANGSTGSLAGGSGTNGGSVVPPGKAPLLIGAAYQRNANAGDSSLG